VFSTGGIDVPITNGSRYEPAVLMSPSPMVLEPAVMAPLSPTT